MNFYPSKENPSDVKVVSQGVDTLVTSHIAINEIDYDKKFVPLLRKLEDLKDNAQLIDSSNQKVRYVKSNILGMGQFKIYAQGMGMYKYILENEDLTIFIANSKFEANEGNTPQIKVEMRAHFLFAVSYKKAYELVLKMVHKMIGETRNLCNRIDIYTDVQGIKYTAFDEMRFQTNYKSTEFSVRKHSKFKNVTGFSYGNGDFMFRIYDKTKEITLRKNKSFIMYKWMLNDYDKLKALPVFRHEVQYRRAELTKFMAKGLHDEVLYFFQSLNKLWNNAISKIRWTDLSNDEVTRISENALKSDSIKKIFQRARENPKRLDFWNILKNWDNKLTTQIAKYNHVKEPKDSTAKKFLKAYIGATYSARGNNPNELINIIDDVTRELRDILGITLHDYGELKVVSNFIENSKMLLKDGLQPDMDNTQTAFSLYSKLCEKLKGIDSPIQKELNKASNLFKKLDVS